MKSFKPRSAKLSIIGFCSLITMMFYQNCSDGFKVKSDALGSSIKSNSIAAVCTNGAKESGYSMSSVLYPLTCGTLQTRTCVNGQWDKNLTLTPNCKQQCVHPDTLQPVDEGSSYFSYSMSTAATTALCEASKVTSVCDHNTGLFAPAIAANKACLVQGQTCAYPTGTGLSVPTGNMVNNTVSGFISSTALYPTLCGTQVSRTCQANGQWTGTIPLYSSCAQKCVHPDTTQPADAGSNYVFYTQQTGSQAQCDAARVTSSCQQGSGVFSPAVPATRYASCAVILPAVIASFSASQTSIVSGSMVTLNWATSNATTLTLNPGMLNVTGQTSAVLSPGSTTTYSLVATNSLGSVTSSVTVTVTGPLMGVELYTNKCAGCHAAYEVSTLKGRTITTNIIDAAIKTKISAMKPLDGTMTVAQLDSITALFANTGPVTPLTSSFACNSADAEKNSSAQLIRLTGPELRNTYTAVLPAAVWSALSTYYYLLPPDQLEGLIKNFPGIFTPDNADQISRFNEQVANQIVASSANVTAFFGACASLTAFPKTCFDSFLTSKGPFIFRSALATDDNSSLWATVTQATTVPTQLKTLVQLLLNDPRFLYHIELGEGAADANGLVTLTSYEIANRISYGMTSAPPDSALWAAAVQNSLKVLTNVTAQVDRLAATAAFKNRIIDLVKFYVGVSTAGTATNVTDFLNGINPTNINVDATNEFNDFVNYIVFTQNGTLKDLFSSKAAFPRTATMASILGTSVWSSGAPMTAPNHPGILTKPYLQLISDPNLKLVQRGKRLRINMLCTDVPQPSATDLAARPMIAESDLVTLNRRDYINKATLAGASCIVCHSKMNQLGFATENYDSLGRYITTEKIYNSNGVKVSEHAVVSSTVPAITETDTRTFLNVSDFQMGLAQSDTLQQCFARKSFQFFQRKEENLTNDSCRLNKMDTLIKTDKPLVTFFIENFKQQSMLYKRSN